MDWKGALSEGWVVYTRDLLEFFKLTLIYIATCAVGFGAPLAIAIIIFLTSVGGGASITLIGFAYVVIFLICVMIGLLVFFALSGGYYAACNVVYNEGKVNVMEYLEFSERHARTSISIAIYQFSVIFAVALPLAAIGFLVRSDVFWAIAGAVIGLAAIIVAGFFSLAMPSVAIDDYNSNNAMKRSYRTVIENKRNFVKIYMVLVLFGAVFLLVPVLGYLLFLFLYLPYMVLVFLVFYRSQRRP